MFELFKFLHIVTAMIWFGAGVGLVALTAIMAKDRAATGAVAPHMEKVGQRLFGPAAGLTLVFGVIAVLVSPDARGIDFEDLWVIVGFAGFLLSGVVTMVANPATRRVAALAAEKGPDAPEVAAGARKITNLHLLDLLILLVVIAAMVFKPGAAG